MSTITKEWLLRTIAELEEERDAVPGAVNEDAVMALEAMKRALASLEANGTLANEGTIKATQFKPVADLYEVTVPSGRSTTFTKDAAEASDCRVMGWSVQEYVKLERYQAAMLHGAEPVSNRDELPDGWVACSERMPKESGRYLCYVEEQNDLGKSHYQWNCAWNGKRWWVEHEDGGRVTHWQPLPSPPQK